MTQSPEPTLAPTQQPRPRPPPTATSPDRVSPSLHPKHLFLPLPLSPHTTLHLQITALTTSTLVFITTTDPSTTSSLSALGSFVYSMPNVKQSPPNLPRFTATNLRVQRFQPTEALSTPLYAVPGSIDFTTRVAKILARKTGKPSYVGSSAVFGNYGIEEEMAGLRAVVEGVMSIWDEGKD